MRFFIILVFSFLQLILLIHVFIDSKKLILIEAGFLSHYGEIGGANHLTLITMRAVLLIHTCYW